MAIFAHAGSKVISQGFTGRQATFYAERARAYGTQFVGGVRPGKGGTRHLGLPVFNTVREARAETGADASIVFVPAEHAGAAMIEAIEAGIELIVAVTERVPVHDMVRVRAALTGSQSRLIGPNSQGVLVPGACQIGVMTTVDTSPGRIGVVSRSASLTSEAVSQLNRAGHGQSTIVGIGGDPLIGTDFVPCLAAFDADADTDAIVMIGEIGGDFEEVAADWIGAANPRTPVVALVVGEHAPLGTRMGHAGTVSEIGSRGVADKIDRLAAAGARIADNVDAIVPTVAAALATQTHDQRNPA